ncbi:MAG: thioesterase family protein [Thermoanaerobaculia bacterium]
MLLLFRFVFTILKSRFRRRIGPLDTSVVRFTALPHDCDLNLHVNSGRYISFMDIARVELLGRMRILSKMLRRGWRPIMGGALVRFRRSVLPFERFEIHSRVVGWDDKWFYIEHIVEREGTFYAIGHMRTLIRKADGNVTPGEMMELMGIRLESPPLPDVVVKWRELEDAR